MLTAVKPTLDVFSITWNLGPRCNFDCAYCPPRWHNKTSDHQTLDQLKARWIYILEKTLHLSKKYKLSFSGGEVTINKDFLPFLRWLNENYRDRIANMGFTTNGSATVLYYKQAIELVDYISFSSHFDQMNTKKFNKNILATHIEAVKKRKNIFVNIMQENIPEVDDLVAECEKHRIPYMVNEINWGLE
jgi:MoaA/NifB/PqqE/SkfB family radical SAM enzyme